MPDPVHRLSSVTDESVASVIGRLYADTRAYASAEITVWKAIASERSGDAGIGAGLAVGALLIASSTVTALMVGVVLTLATLIGPGLATLIVLLVGLVVTGILGWLAVGRFKRVTAPTGDVA